jgi:hypothetical protein
MAAKVKVANTSFTSEAGGVRWNIKAGQRLPANHPLVKKLGSFFEDPSEVDVEAPPRRRKAA